MGMQDEISGVVNWDVPSVNANDNLKTLICKFVDNNTTALIVKLQDEVLGIVTEMDLMESIDNQDDINETSISSIMTPCELITADLAKSPCVQLDENETVENAIGIMTRAGVHHLIVSGAESKVGVISVLDLFKLVIN